MILLSIDYFNSSFTYTPLSPRLRTFFENPRQYILQKLFNFSASLFIFSQIFHFVFFASRLLLSFTMVQELDRIEP